MSGTGISVADAGAIHEDEPQAHDPDSRPVPAVCHYFAPLDPDLRELRHVAAEEVVILIPVQQRIGVYSYGLPETCRRLADHLLKQDDAIHAAAGILGKRLLDWRERRRVPKAVRLERRFWLEMPAGVLGLAVPLSSHPVQFRLHYDTVTYTTLTWDPDELLYFIESGPKIMDGSLRFLLLVLYLDTQSV